MKNKIVSMMFFSILFSALSIPQTVFSSDSSSIPSEVALAITDQGIFPQIIHLQPETPYILYVLSSMQGELVIESISDKIILKKNVIKNFPLKASQDTFETKVIFQSQSGGEGLSAILSFKPVIDSEKVEIVLLGGHKQFLPVKTTIPENQAFTLLTFSTQNYPHSDFVLLGTEFPVTFKKQTLLSHEISELKAGTYPISRPKFPKQKHGISTYLEVIHQD